MEISSDCSDVVDDKSLLLRCLIVYFEFQESRGRSSRDDDDLGVRKHQMSCRESERRMVMDRRSAEEQHAGQMRSFSEIARKPKSQKPLLITVKNDFTANRYRDAGDHHQSQNERERGRQERTDDETSRVDSNRQQASFSDHESSDDVDSDYTIEMRSQKDSDDDDDDDDSVYSVEFKNFGGSDDEGNGSDDEQKKATKQDQSLEGRPEDEALESEPEKNYSEEEEFKKLDEKSVEQEDESEEDESERNGEIHVSTAEERRTVTVTKSSKSVSNVDEHEWAVNDKNEKESGHVASGERFSTARENGMHSNESFERRRSVIVSEGKQEAKVIAIGSVDDNSISKDTEIDQRQGKMNSDEHADRKKDGKTSMKDGKTSAKGDVRSDVIVDTEFSPQDKVIPKSASAEIKGKIVKERNLREEIKLLEKRLGKEQAKKALAGKGKDSEYANNATGSKSEEHKIEDSKKDSKVAKSKSQGAAIECFKERRNEQVKNNAKQKEKKELETSGYAKTDKWKGSSGDTKTNRKDATSPRTNASMPHKKLVGGDGKGREGSKEVKDDLPKPQKKVEKVNVKGASVNKEKAKFAEAKVGLNFKKGREGLDKTRRKGRDTESPKLKKGSRKISESSYSSSSESSSSSSSSSGSESESASDKSGSRSESSGSESVSSSESSQSSSSESESSTSEEENFKRRRRRSSENVKSADKRTRPTTLGKERRGGYVSPLRTKRSEWGTRRQDEDSRRPSERFENGRDHSRRQARGYSREGTQQRTRSRSRSRSRGRGQGRTRGDEHSRDRDRRDRNTSSYKPDNSRARSPRNAHEKLDRDREARYRRRSHDRFKGRNSLRDVSRERARENSGHLSTKKALDTKLESNDKPHDKKTFEHKVDPDLGDSKATKERTAAQQSAASLKEKSLITSAAKSSDNDTSKFVSLLKDEIKKPKPLMALNVKEASLFKEVTRVDSRHLKSDKYDNDSKRSRMSSSVNVNENASQTMTSKKNPISINNTDSTKQRKKVEPKPLMEITLPGVKPRSVVDAGQRSSRRVSLTGSSQSVSVNNETPSSHGRDQHRRVTRIETGRAEPITRRKDDFRDRENREGYSGKETGNSRVYLKRLSSGKEVTFDRRNIEPLMKPMDVDLSSVLKKPRIIEKKPEDTEDQRSIRRVITDASSNVPQIQFTTNGKNLMILYYANRP